MKAMVIWPAFLRTELKFVSRQQRKDGILILMEGIKIINKAYEKLMGQEWQGKGYNIIQYNQSKGSVWEILQRELIGFADSLNVKEQENCFQIICLV